MNFTSMGSCAGRPEIKASSACPCDSPAVQNFSIGADTLTYSCFGSTKTNSLSASALCVQQADFRRDLLEQVGTALVQIRPRNALGGAWAVAQPPRELPTAYRRDRHRTVVGPQIGRAHV